MRQRIRGGQLPRWDRAGGCSERHAGGCADRLGHRPVGAVRAGAEDTAAVSEVIGLGTLALMPKGMPPRECVRRPACMAWRRLRDTPCRRARLGYKVATTFTKGPGDMRTVQSLRPCSAATGSCIYLVVLEAAVYVVSIQLGSSSVKAPMPCRVHPFLEERRCT